MSEQDIGKVVRLRMQRKEGKGPEVDLSGFYNDPRLEGLPKAVKLLWKAYAGGAKSRNLLFCLSPLEFISRIEGTCWYCGGAPNAKVKGRHGGDHSGFKTPYNGIDRIDSSEGYTIKNTVSCCRTCNMMKTNHALLYFLRHVDRIADYQRDKKREQLKTMGILTKGSF